MLPPLLKTRFLVILPSEFEIEPFQVSEMSLPNIIFENNWFGSIVKNSDCEFEIMNTVENSSNKKWVDFIKHNKITIDFRIELLDPLGMVNEEYVINGFIKSINFDIFSHGDNGLFKTKVVFGVNNFTLN